MLLGITDTLNKKTVHLRNNFHQQTFPCIQRKHSDLALVTHRESKMTLAVTDFTIGQGYVTLM